MSAPPVPVAPLRVVLADHTADLRDLLGVALARVGFDVVGEASDAQGAVEVVRRECPDVILVDLALPAADGAPAVPLLRGTCPRAAIVVLSSFGSARTAARASLAGADGYVQKGASIAAVVAQVQQVVALPSTDRPRLAVPVPPVAPAVATPAAVRPLTDDRSRAESAWEALELAPWAVVEVADEPGQRLLHVNQHGRRLLGPCAPGTPLADVAPQLASRLRDRSHAPDATFTLGLGRRELQVTVRRTAHTLVVYLDRTRDDAADLRRAIGAAAHELRGPVTVLTGIAETLGAGWEIAPEHRTRLLGAVGRQARILDGVTADLVTATQIQRGTLRVEPEPLDLLALALAVVADRYGDEVTVVCDGAGPFRVSADPTRVEQMLVNLLGNAHKYGAAPIGVRLRPTDDGAAVHLDVVDHGPGVPEAFRAHLFEEFARAENGAVEGLGLGLHIVRTLARAQGGDVEHRPGEDGGSVFTLRLPAVATG